MKLFVLLLCFVLTIQHPLYASQEEVVHLTRIDVQGPADKAGSARIQIESLNGGISSVRLAAFGRSITLSQDNIAKLKGFQFSKVAISFEAGYKQTGGFCVYFVLSNRPYSIDDPFDAPPSPKTFAEFVRITVKENEEVLVERRATKTPEKPDWDQSSKIVPPANTSKEVAEEPEQDQ